MKANTLPVQATIYRLFVVSRPLIYLSISFPNSITHFTVKLLTLLQLNLVLDPHISETDRYTLKPLLYTPIISILVLSARPSLGSSPQYNPKRRAHLIHLSPFRLLLQDIRKAISRLPSLSSDGPVLS